MKDMKIKKNKAKMLFGMIILFVYSTYDGSASIIFPGPELMASVYSRNHMTAAESENRHSVLIFFV